MFERLGHRLASSILNWDVFLTLVTLFETSHIRTSLGFGNSIRVEQTRLAPYLYLAVAVIWTVIFLLVTPQRALFRNNLLEAIGRLLMQCCGCITFAGLLYLTSRDVSRLQFIYFALGNLVNLLMFLI